MKREIFKPINSFNRNQLDTKKYSDVIQIFETNFFQDFTYNN